MLVIIKLTDGSEIEAERGEDSATSVIVSNPLISGTTYKWLEKATARVEINSYHILAISELSELDAEDYKRRL